MEQYYIYPVKGKAASDYLLLLGCSAGPHIMNIPDYLRVVQTSNELIYDVMYNNEKLFTMQYYPTARWRIIIPVKYQMSFYELTKAYSFNEALTEGIIGSSRLAKPLETASFLAVVNRYLNVPLPLCDVHLGRSVLRE